MSVFNKVFLFTLLAFGATTSVAAANYRLDFSGQSINGTYAGYAILDFDALDEDPDASRAVYDGIVVQLSLLVDGITYVDDSGIVNLGVVTNGTEVGDLFGFGVAVIGDSGQQDFFAIQFQNLDGTAFSSDALPTSLDLTDFDPYDVTNTNSTGVILPLVGLSGADEFLALGSASLYPVPLPAGLLLMLSAVATLLGFKSRKT